MNELRQKQAILRKQFAAFMDTARAIMIQLETNAKESTSSSACLLPQILLIQTLVAKDFNVPITVMSARIRTNKYVTPRHVAMMFARELTEHTLEDIGASFLRDHSAIVHAINATTRRIETEPMFAEKVKVLRANCQLALMENAMPQIVA